LRPTTHANINRYVKINVTYILWRHRPMRELIKFRNLKEHDCATIAERCCVLLPPFPSLCSACCWVMW
jgi:hypothetical protein